MPASLPRRSKLLYGTGETAESIKLYAFEIFLFFYYTQVLGLSGSLTGFALFIALFIDAITDPIIASMSDNFRSRWGRRHPMMLAAIIPLMVTFYLVFSPPADLSNNGLFFWLCGFSILVRVAITFFYVPYLAMGAELSGDYDERTSLVTYRLAFGVIAGIAVVMLGFSVFFKASEEFANGQLDASAYPEFGFTFALLMGMAMLSSALGTKRHIRDLPTSYGSNKAFSLVLAWQDFKCVFSNRLFFILFISALLVLVMRSIQATLGMHINTFFWQLTSEQIQWIVLAGVIGLLSGMPFARLLNQRFERKSLFISGLLIFIFFQNMPIILRMLGWLALQQTQLLVLLLVSAFISGVGVVQFMIAGTAMFSDISDAHEIENNLGQQAMFFAGLVFLTKVATGMGHLIAGVAIDWIAFPIDANPGDVGESTLMQLAFVFGPGATLIGIIAFFTLSRYSLPRAKVLQNQKHLESMRTGE